MPYQQHPPIGAVRPLLCALALFLGASGATAALGEANTVTLADHGVTLTVETAYGRVLALIDEDSGAGLCVPRDAAENFRLLVPSDANAENRILGRDQSLSALEREGDVLHLRWDGPLADEAGARHDIDVAMDIALRPEGAAFTLSLENRGDSIVTEVWYPVLGGVLGLDGTEDGAKVSMGPPNVGGKSFSLPFGEHAASYPGLNMAYVDLTAQRHNRGLYFGAHDLVARQKHFRFFEVDKNVYAALAHHPFVSRGETFAGGEAVFQFHDGDWVAAGRQIYRPWFVESFGLRTPEEDWIRQQGVYQMIMILLPEGNVNYRFSEVPQLARDGLKYGVKALQLAGWQRGGHDNGYPYYEPDPRLGTWGELEDAIRKCHALGVKVYFFVNVTVVNLDTEWYKEELKDCGWESARGADYWVAGWGMGTLASRMAHTVPLMAFSDMSFPAMHDGHLRYFKKLAEIGADGIHIDKFFPGHMNFNPRTALSPDQAQWEGAIRLVHDIDQECRAINPGFRISFETNWDRVLPYAAGTWWSGNMSRAVEVFPELVETVGLYQPYDYIGVNSAVLNRLTIMASPHHFNRSMAYPTWRGLSKYIRQVIRWRQEAADVLFYGAYLPPGEGLMLSAGDGASGVQSRSFRGLRTGRLGAVVAHNGEDPAEVVLESLGQASRVRVTGPDRRPEELALPARVTVAPEHVLFVVEQPANGSGK